MESRIVDLEMRFMQQDSTIQELNEVLISQQKQIDELSREVDLLKKQIRASSPSLIRDPSEETPPPHY
ncbi:MAG: SlyX family protein [Proteobacteria bacterium]|nr:SlyX family protein [Pseudomonadota bacterium]